MAVYTLVSKVSIYLTPCVMLIGRNKLLSNFQSDSIKCTSFSLILGVLQHFKYIPNIILGIVKYNATKEDLHLTPNFALHMKFQENYNFQILKSEF